MALKLQVFETAQEDRSKNTVVLDTMHLEETKLASYDSGYSAGWEDASAAQSSDQSKAKADLARNLQALGFTYHEARSHILKGLRPLFTEIVGRLLPEIARLTLAPIILDALIPLAETHADVPVEIRLNPSARSAVEILLQGATSLPVQITEEPSLSEGQAYLKLGSSESQVNLDRVMMEIGAAITTFFDAPKKEMSNG
jgi:flagellar biosynthesis/type III secretory pathway protein FliH